MVEKDFTIKCIGYEEQGRLILLAFEVSAPGLRWPALCQHRLNVEENVDPTLGLRLGGFVSKFRFLLAKDGFYYYLLIIDSKQPAPGLRFITREWVFRFDNLVQSEGDAGAGANAWPALVANAFWGSSFREDWCFQFEFLE